MFKDVDKGSKNVSEKNIIEFVNYHLFYPSYKEGLDNIMNDFI